MKNSFPAFEISKKKAYEIFKQRACGISKKKSDNILAFMGFRSMTSKSKYFPAYELSKESLKNSGFHGIQTHGPLTEYYSAYDISTKKAF